MLINHPFKMVRLFFLSLLTVNCKCQDVPVSSTIKDDKISCVKISRLFPDITPSGNINGYDTIDVEIFDRGEQRMFKSSYSHANIRLTDTTEPRYLKVYRYFVYTRGNTFGLLFDSTKKIDGRPVLTDSMINDEWITGVNFESIFENNVTSFISATPINDKTGLEEHYSFRNIKDTTMTGDAYLVYSDKPELKKIPFSFSKKLDSVKQMKLLRVVRIFNRRFVKEYNSFVDKIELPYWMEEVKDISDEKVGHYFRKEQGFKYQNR